MAERPNDAPAAGSARPATTAQPVVQYVPAVPAPVVATEGLDEAPAGGATYLLSDGKTRVNPDGEPVKRGD